MNTTAIGNNGEQLAAEAMVRDGYRILDRNWKTPMAEIDIIASRSGVLYFAEVKFRKSSAQGDGFDYITSKKLQHMQRAAQLWVAKHGWPGEVSLLGISVTGTEGDVDIREI